MIRHINRMVLVLVGLSFLGTTTIAYSMEKVIGGLRSDRGVYVLSTSKNGYLIVGVTESQGAGREDIYLVRLDSDGEVLWENAIGGPGDDDGWAAIETDSAGFVIAGFTNSRGAGGLDCHLVATDSAGATLWSRTYGGTEDDRCWAVAQTPDGGYVLAGETARPSAGKRDCFLVRTDADGKELWSKNYGGTEDDRCFSITTADDGGFVIAGQSYTYGAGDRDAWILKADGEGNLEWSKTHGGERSDVAHSVVAAGEDSYVVIGYTTSLATSPDDPMILRISGDGRITSSSVVEMTGHNRAITGSLTTAGDLCVAGLHVGGQPRITAALIAKIDASGHLLWSKEIAPTTHGKSFGYGVTATADGGCAITGHTTVESAGDLDLLFAAVDSEGN